MGKISEAVKIRKDIFIPARGESLSLVEVFPFCLLQELSREAKFSKGSLIPLIASGSETATLIILRLIRGFNILIQGFEIIDFRGDAV